MRKRKMTPLLALAMSAILVLSQAAAGAAAKIPGKHGSGCRRNTG